ncbi:Nuclear distribution protein PAC1-1 [Hondaea fermentalgiana]|uniref:Lissencephaly-1 homolog n=1 Tax=Hondaea fermentalgiana TaxID=2315210 RepID=A0A2R5H004_9STRA|nr:Nuclear distribution protein PAC1-1 [Hondaea fermentalgiana]|eukprot:GBG34061.1 Nuclear distribution protein PAC1-1 [Hondaea fermentalgiana]
MVLTEKQRNELHKAMVDYLASDDQFRDAAKALSAAFGLDDENAEAPAAAKGTPLLERKWTSVVRLQRKVLDLEQKVKDLEAERKAGGFGYAGGSNGGAGGGGPDGLRAGETYVLKTTSRARLQGHRAPVTCVCFHPRFNMLVSASEDASLKLWDFETGEFERTLKGHTNVVQDVAFNGDGSLLASCSADMSIKLWDFAPGGSQECVRTLMGHDHNVTGISFLPENPQQLVSCSRDKTIKVWDSTSGYCLRTLTGHDDWVRKLAVHRGSSLLATCSSDQSVILWNLAAAAGGELLERLRGHEHVVEAVAFSSATADKALTKGLGPLQANGAGHDAAQPPRAPQHLSNNHADQAQAGGAAYVVSGSRDRTVKVWQVATGVCLMTLTGHDNWVRAVAFQPHGKYLLTASEDKSVRIWDLEQQRCVRTVANAHSHFITSMAPHPKLALVATGSVDTEVALWAAAPASASV